MTEEYSDNDELFDISNKIVDKIDNDKPATKQKKPSKTKLSVTATDSDILILPKAKSKRNRTEEQQKEMIERLAKMRVKAFEKRMENKKLREVQKVEEKEKVEKVNKYLKNEDLFEKKYADKFEKITDLISSVSADVSEIKEHKRKKQEQKQKELAERLEKERLEKEKLEKEKLDVEENKSIDFHIDKNTKVSSSSMIVVPSNYDYMSNSPTLKHLPNYRKIKFGKQIK
jgi:hypothetical protein